eukprot:XP_001691449.1 predicted protein [Chlamydomonas reinhardtii]
MAILKDQDQSTMSAKSRWKSEKFPAHVEEARNSDGNVHKGFNLLEFRVAAELLRIGPYHSTEDYWAPVDWQLLLLVSEYMSALLEFLDWFWPEMGWEHHKQAIVLSKRLLQPRSPNTFPSLPIDPQLHAAWRAFTYCFWHGTRHLAAVTPVGVATATYTAARDWLNKLVGERGFEEEGPITSSLLSWTESMGPRLQEAFPNTSIDWAQWPAVTWPDAECGCRAVEKRGAVKRQTEEEYAVRWPLRVTQGRPKFNHAKVEARDGFVVAIPSMKNPPVLSFLAVSDVMTSFKQAAARWPSTTADSPSQALQQEMAQSFVQNVLRATRGPLAPGIVHEPYKYLGYVACCVQGWETALPHIMSIVRETGAWGSQPLLLPGAPLQTAAGLSQLLTVAAAAPPHHAFLQPHAQLGQPGAGVADAGPTSQAATANQAGPVSQGSASSPEGSAGDPPQAAGGARVTRTRPSPFAAAGTRKPAAPTSAGAAAGGASATAGAAAGGQLGPRQGQGQAQQGAGAMDGGAAPMSLGGLSSMQELLDVLPEPSNVLQPGFLQPATMHTAGAAAAGSGMAGLTTFNSAMPLGARPGGEAGPSGMGNLGGFSSVPLSAPGRALGGLTGAPDAPVHIQPPSIRAGSPFQGTITTGTLPGASTGGRSDPASPPLDFGATLGGLGDGGAAARAVATGGRRTRGDLAAAAAQVAAETGLAPAPGSIAEPATKRPNSQNDLAAPLRAVQRLVTAERVESLGMYLNEEHVTRSQHPSVQQGLPETTQAPAAAAAAGAGPASTQGILKVEIIPVNDSGPDLGAAAAAASPAGAAPSQEAGVKPVNGDLQARLQQLLREAAAVAEQLADQDQQAARSLVTETMRECPTLGALLGGSGVGPNAEPGQGAHTQSLGTGSAPAQS